MSWEKVKLGDICDFINGGAWSDKEYVSLGIPVLKVSNFKPSGFFIDDINYLPPDSAEKYEKNKLLLNDVIIATVGSHPNLQDSAAGRSCVVNSLVTGFYLNQNAVCVRTKNNDVLEQRYLGFLAKTQDFLHYIQSSGRGAANQMRIAIGAIKEYEFVLPPMAIQRRIADILSAYDELIENNRKQIKLLEEAAQRLYKEWFVDLRFPGHEHTKIVDSVPEGWEPCILDDVIEFDPKVRLDKDRIKQFVPMSALSTSSMVLDMNEISETTSNSGSKFQNGDTLLARITPCLENGKTAFVHGLESDEGAVGSTEYIVMRSKKLNPYMVYLLSRTNGFRQSAINSMSGSDGRQRVKADKLKALAYFLPPTGLVHSFEQMVSPMFEMVFALNRQIFAATQARDRLLPKLMRGE